MYNHSSRTPGDTAHMKKFGALIKGLRNERGLSQEKVGEAIGLTQKAISKLERGDSKIPLSDTLHRLANYFQVDAGDLLRGKVTLLAVSNLTPEESELILIFHDLSASGQAYILGRARDIHRDERGRDSDKPDGDHPDGHKPHSPKHPH